jgi:predicted acylesterase/phospholipase RssA
LTGGGYRGLFTAKVLVELCRLAKAKGPLNKTFDVFAGTSIGGLLACALAVGVDPQRVLDAIDSHGSRVFPKKSARTARLTIFGSLYDAGALKAAIDSCLGAWAQRPIGDVKAGLLVPAVNWTTGRTELFMSRPMGARFTSKTTLADVCLATSAAPTFFEPHEIEGAPMLDGGLVANNPDGLLLMEVARRWPNALQHLEVLSIGTAGGDAGGMAANVPSSRVGWAPRIATFMIAAQERLASDQAERMLGRRYLRVNHAPSAGQQAFADMDIVDASMRDSLLTVGEATAKDAYRKHKASIDRLFRGVEPM